MILRFFSEYSDILERHINWAGAQNATITNCSPSSKLTGLNQSQKWRDILHFWSNCQVPFDTGLADFNPGHFKTWMKKVAAQVNFCLSCNAFLSQVQYGAWKWAHVCSIEVWLTLLHHFILQHFTVFYRLLLNYTLSPNQGFSYWTKKWQIRQKKQMLGHLFRCSAHREKRKCLTRNHVNASIILSACISAI